jgi:tetratricopeptide (TPR) repeat protein
MTDWAPNWRLILFLFLSFHLAGCGQLRRSSLDEEKEPHFMEGKKRSLRADWDGAIHSYERALQANPRNASAHFELGVLYDSKKNDYAAAIYHYQRHLALRTNSPMADVVKEYVRACTRELAKTVQYAVVTREVQRDLERFQQTNALYKRQLEELRAELARRPQYITNNVTNFVTVQMDPRSTSRLTQQTQPVVLPEDEEEPEPPAARTPPPRTQPDRVAQRAPTPSQRRESPAPSNSSARIRATHTVRPGETLAALASRYRVSLAALKAANPSAANGVRAGQKIKIPQ